MLLVFLIVLFSLVCAHAQNTSVSCSSTYGWMRNSMGQSPCLVTAWLQSPCVGRYEVGASTYRGPTNGTAQPCICNTISYSTLAACAICQGAGLDGIAPWPSFSQNCRSVARQQYPETVPNGTSIPVWAYLPLLNNTFDIKMAQNLASLDTPAMSITSSTSSNPITNMPSKSPSALPSASRASSATASSSDIIRQTSPDHIEGGALVTVMVVSMLALSAAIAGIIVAVRRKWLPDIQVESRRRSALQIPVVRMPSLRVPSIRMPALQMPTLRMPALRIPVVRMPAVPLPAWCKRGRQHEAYNMEDKMNLFYDPDDPRTFPPSPTPADIYFYRCRQKAAANAFGSADGRSYTDVTVALGGVLPSTVSSTVASSPVPTSPLRGYSWRPEGEV